MDLHRIPALDKSLVPVNILEIMWGVHMSPPTAAMSEFCLRQALLNPVMF